MIQLEGGGREDSMRDRRQEEETAFHEEIDRFYNYINIEPHSAFQQKKVQSKFKKASLASRASFSGTR